MQLFKQVSNFIKVHFLISWICLQNQIVEEYKALNLWVFYTVRIVARWNLNEWFGHCLSKLYIVLSKFISLNCVLSLQSFVFCYNNARYYAVLRQHWQGAVKLGEISQYWLMTRHMYEVYQQIFNCGTALCVCLSVPVLSFLDFVCPPNIHLAPQLLLNSSGGKNIKHCSQVAMHIYLNMVAALKNLLWSLG